MKIYKIGHACFVFEEEGTKILTDPGQFSTENLEREEIIKTRGLDAVLITHIHGDHLNVDSLKGLIENNPGVGIVGNEEVKKLLGEKGIEARAVADSEKFTVGKFNLQAFETDHAPIHNDIPVPRNTGFLFDGRVYHPGDALFAPPGHIDLLGVPFGAPWATVGELIDYALEVEPGKITPSHDGLLRELGPFQFVAGAMLGKFGIEFVPLRPGEEYDL